MLKNWLSLKFEQNKSVKLIDDKRKKTITLKHVTAGLVYPVIIIREEKENNKYIRWKVKDTHLIGFALLPKKFKKSIDKSHCF